jgi:hypothetical protein
MERQRIARRGLLESGKRLAFVAESHPEACYGCQGKLPSIDSIHGG